MADTMGPKVVALQYGHGDVSPWIGFSRSIPAGTGKMFGWGPGRFSLPAAPGIHTVEVRVGRR